MSAKTTLHRLLSRDLANAKLIPKSLVSVSFVCEVVRDLPLPAPVTMAVLPASDVAIVCQKLDRME